MKDTDFENDSTNKYVQLTEREAMIYGMVGILGDCLLRANVEQTAKGLIAVNNVLADVTDAKKVWVSAHRKIMTHAGLGHLLSPKKPE